MTGTKQIFGHVIQISWSERTMTINIYQSVWYYYLLSETNVKKKVLSLNCFLRDYIKRLNTLFFENKLLSDISK